ncbi:chemotaxis protein [Helicobacter pametensis]|uniref:chemotaxis protein n=1 Tax=Helicobacter pametensis TaxID=95149 RepID=UPI0004804A48|nr:chemotaxis protein [Helicobacter pametensis]
MTNLSNIIQVTNLHKNNELQLLCFYLQEQGDLYGINVFKVKEIIKYKGTITKISYENSSLVEGLISIRGVDLPLLDMRKWFHYSPDEPTRDLTPFGVQSKSDETIIMVCEFSKWIVGIKIFQAHRILSKKWEEIEQEINFSTDLKHSKFISKTHYFDGRLVQIVDVEKMLIDIFPWIQTEQYQELSTLSPIHHPKTILYADDSPIVLKTIQTILDRLQLKHYAFYNGKALLDFIHSRHIPTSEIALIITDLEMPEISGFEVIKQIKEDPQTAHIPVIINSSMSGNSNKDMALSLNADGFISKSNPKQIENIIRHFLEEL